MYSASIGEETFQIELGEKVMMNGLTKQVQCSKAGNGFVMMMDGIQHEADIVKLDKEQKLIVLRIKGKKYHVQIKEPVDLLLERLGINVKLSKKVNSLKAPMPGMIMKVLVKEGDSIKQGEPLLILEAMKMENVFKALNDAVVKSVKIEEKDRVEKGQLLIEFEA